MRDDDHHLWFSTSKTVAGLLVGLLEADGKVDVDKPIDHYLPELTSTHWHGIRIIDILDMASGLDLVENEQSRTDPSSPVNHFFRIELGDTSGLGKLTSDQILFSAGDKSPAGEAFEYSSMNTKMLGLLVERVSGKRLADLLSERVWSKLGAEGDAQVGVNLEGGAAIYGMMSSRLRDKARYGLLYTPSWKAVSEEPVVPQSLIDKIQHGCRPEIYKRGAMANGRYDPEAESRCNSRQWDAVFADGDMYKGGARGQGIYVSPDRDIVIAWFSTTSESGWMNYARAIARTLAPVGR
jgi:CubicO group peptidase (beta-lactamase class C family)